LKPPQFFIPGPILGWLKTLAYANSLNPRPLQLKWIGNYHPDGKVLNRKPVKNGAQVFRGNAPEAKGAKESTLIEGSKYLHPPEIFSPGLIASYA